MNTQPHAMPESLPGSQGIAPAVVSATRLLYWSVRRELWENRSIYIAPLAVAGVVLFGFLIATIGRAVATIDPARKAAVLAEPTDFAAFIIMGTTFVVAVFYCLDALHGERRDRSILFWKSLPVSDLTTVLAKASIPLVVLPLITFAITVAMQWIMLLLSAAVLSASGGSAATMWARLPWFRMSLMLFYHLVAIHGLWYAPFYGWLLLVSGWARRAAFLWAALPLLAIGIVEKIVFNTSHFAAMLGNRFTGGTEGAAFTRASVTMNPLIHLAPGHFLIDPGLWLGLAIFAAFLATAIRLRRYQGPI